MKYTYVRVGHDKRIMTFKVDGTVGQGSARCELFWDLELSGEDQFLAVYGDCQLTMKLKLDGEGTWRGQWLHYERMDIALVPLVSAHTTAKRR
jgi:hypothetical protein